MAEQLGLFDVEEPAPAPVASRPGRPQDWLDEAHLLRVRANSPECADREGSTVTDLGRRLRRRAHTLEHEALAAMGRG